MDRNQSGLIFENYRLGQGLARRGLRGPRGRARTRVPLSGSHHLAPWAIGDEHALGE